MDAAAGWMEVGSEKMSWSRKEMLGGKMGGQRGRRERGQRGVWRNVREAEKGVSSGRLPAALPPLWSYLACLLGVHTAPPHPSYPADPLQSPLLSTLYLQQAKRLCDALHFTCFVRKHIEARMNIQTHAGIQTCREQKSWTGKINILVVTLHLPLSVSPMEEETETDRANVKTESLKVQM